MAESPAGVRRVGAAPLASSEPAPLASSEPAPLAGRTIGITADRRWEEQASLFIRRGATVMHGPTMRTIDLAGDDALRRATAEVLAAPPAIFVVTTGMGMRAWLGAADTWGQRDALVAALASARVVARGAKSASAIKATGLAVWWQAPGERMEEIVAHLAVHAAGEAIAVQMFDPAEHPSTSALRSLAGRLIEVPVYQWDLPSDATPALRLVDASIAGALDAVTFTSQPAVRFLFRLAGPSGPALRDAFNHGGLLAACVGPVCAEAAREEGIAHPEWPSPARLPALVRMVTAYLS